MLKDEFNAVLKTKKELAKDLLYLCFLRPDNFNFSAGQFVQFEVPLSETLSKTDSKQKIALRSYSIASAPSDKFLEFCVKLLPDGVASKFFLSLPVGATANFFGPAGRFTCESVRDCVFIATGSGIAPIISQIRDQLENCKSKSRLTLIFGLRDEEDIFWQEKFEDLAKKYQNFSFYFTLSRPKDGWIGLSGRVSSHLPDDPRNKDFYICGNSEMVSETRALLIKGGACASDIHFEIF